MVVGPLTSTGGPALFGCAEPPGPMALVPARAPGAVLAFSAARRRPLAPAGGQSGLQAIDACACDPEGRGVVYVEGLVGPLGALARHLVRRVRAAGRPLVTAGGGGGDAWRALARRLGAAAGTDPRAVAAAIRARAGRAVLVVAEGAPTAWGRALLDELEDAEAPGGGFLALVLTERAPAGTEARVLDLGRGLTRDEARLWCEAVAADADEPMAPALDCLGALDAWWEAARTTPAGALPAPVALGAPERQLLRRLVLAQRSLSERDVARLDPDGAAASLLARGLLSADESGCLGPVGAAGDLLARGLLASPPADAGDALAVARLLETLGSDDPWSVLRAAELYAGAGAAGEAEAAAAAALRATPDPAARADFWERYDRALARQPGAAAGAHRLRAADLALALGDVDHALAFAHAAVARLGETHGAMWTLGCATSARGDMTTAAIALGKALALAPDEPSRARAAAQLAEVSYRVGDFGEARRFAGEALAGAAEPATRLGARNVLGKLLLAAAAWTEADRHFAADACDAACAGDRTAELRARLNRALALLDLGRREEARATLLDVLADGRRDGDARAVGRALHNLAVEAHRRNDYGEALRRYAEAIEATQRRGEKIPLAYLVRSLAELQINLGLSAEAEQTLELGRKACGPVMPGMLQADFDLVTAQLHLCLGRTAQAAASVHAAMTHADSSSNGDDLRAQCHLLATRVALEDGDLALAEYELGQGKGGATSARARAEAALLGAQLARAGGAPFADRALEALALAQRAESAERALEAHLLLARAGLEGDDVGRMRSHLAAAAGIRDRMAAALPPDVRARFLGRRDLAVLARLGASAALVATAPPPAASEVRARVARPQAPDATGRIVGRDPAIAALRASILRVASVDATLLVRGESGTGKELVAEAVHAASARRGGPLVKVNCAALVETLLLSELFGHEKGAFTGAASRRQGRFEVAEGGTIFLDEIGDISPRTQTALLRVLQERTFERVGGTTPLRTDCRVICATHRDLKALAAQGSFRDDLYYRLEGLVLQVPPLRRRLGDLPLLADAILDRIAAERGQPPRRLEAGALAALGRHGWPGNVRELENALRAATLFAEGELLRAEDFARHVDGLRALGGRDGEGSADGGGTPVTLRAAEGDAGRAADEAPVDAAYACVRSGVSLGDLKRRLERECIAMALSESGGNITRAAVVLGMKRSRLSQLVKHYGFRATEASAEETES